jgi:glycosyltransferase involved in cell wall biosynthesis
MTSPPVSVVMPSYNHAAFLRSAIDSVLSQDYDALELIVIDGGSQDGSVEILESYGDRLWFVSERDRGQADAINRGFARSTGDILCWLNSDDMFMPGVIPRVVRAFEDDPQAEFVYGRGWDIDESGRIIDEAGVLTFDLWKLIHQRNFIQQPSCFFRRSLLERVGPVDESLHYVMDWELWIRFAAYRGLYVDDFWSYNRVHRDNKTQSGQFRRWAEIRRMVGRYTDSQCPPVVWLYFLEAILQRVRGRRVPDSLEQMLHRVFSRGMRHDMSGRYADGGVARRFRVSIGNPHGRRQVRLTFSPLSRYDRSRRGAWPATVRCRTSAGGGGVFTLHENGVEQQFVITARRPTPFVHVTCWSDHPGVHLGRGAGLPARRIIGFLDAVDL